MTSGAIHPGVPEINVIVKRDLSSGVTLQSPKSAILVTTVVSDDTDRSMFDDFKSQWTILFQEEYIFPRGLPYQRRSQ